MVELPALFYKHISIERQKTTQNKKTRKKQKEEEEEHINVPITRCTDAYYCVELKSFANRIVSVIYLSCVLSIDTYCAIGM